MPTYAVAVAREDAVLSREGNAAQAPHTSVIRIYYTDSKCLLSALDVALPVSSCCASVLVDVHIYTQQAAQSTELPSGLRAFSVVEGVVTRVTPHGVTVYLGSGISGFLHVKQMRGTPGTDPATAFPLGSKVEVRGKMIHTSIC